MKARINHCPVPVLLGFLATLNTGPSAAFAAGPDQAKLGSAGFYPSSEHPVGDMGDGTGRYPGAAAPCLEWQEHAAFPGPDKNILWETRLKGLSQSHPIVVGNKVITLEEPNFVVCLDAGTGKLLWRTQCDHIALFPPEVQQKARDSIKQLTDLFFKEQLLHWEYAWLTGTTGYGHTIVPWYYPMEGMRQRKGNFDDTQATKDRIAAIEKEWTSAGYDDTPVAPPSSGEGFIPYDYVVEKQNNDTRKYDAISQQLIDCRSDYGVCPDLFTITVQTETGGQTQDTPASDGTNIYATFGYGQTACLDLDGKIRWMKWFPEIMGSKASLLAIFKGSFWAEYEGSKMGLVVRSPLLVDDKLIVTQGYAIRALDKATGNLLWTVKFCDPAKWYDRAGCLSGRGAARGPAVMTLKDKFGTKVLICPQGYVIRVSDGKVLCDDDPLDMFYVPFGSNHADIIGLVTDGDVCYYTWGAGAGAIRIVNASSKPGPADKALSFYLWQTTIPEGLREMIRGSGIPRGATNAEGIILGAPVYDPDRKRVYVSTDLSKTLWAFDAVDGHIIDHVAMGDYESQPWEPQKFPAGIVGSPYLSRWGSNNLTDPMLVGNKYIFMPNDMGDCYVMDADDIHKVIAANNVMTQFHRDLAQRSKPWPEIARQMTDHYIYSDKEFGQGNSMNRAPGDPFVSGDKTYVRTLEGMTCISATPATAPIINDAETSGASTQP